jgi:sugar phosphate isomerase/epimerase
MIGCCSSLDNIKLLKDNNFDFIEIKANELEKIPTIEKCIDIYAINNLLPRNLSIFNDLEIIKIETEKVFRTAKNYNVKIITFGSGFCRKINFNINWQNIFDEYLNYLNFLSEKYSIKVGVEPLAKEETDLINNVEEAESYINKYDNLGITLDSFHFFKNDNNFKSIKNNKKK